jgi:hypothetical protein
MTSTQIALSACAKQKTVIVLTLIIEVKMPSLYELNSDLQIALDVARESSEANNGEIAPDLASKIDNLEMDIDNKRAGCVKYYKNESAMAEMYNIEIEAMLKKKQTHENNAKWVKEYIKSTLITEGQKIEYTCGKISWRKSERVIIDSEIGFPEHYYKIEKTLQKTLIKEGLKEGAQLPAHIETVNNIQIK